LLLCPHSYLSMSLLFFFFNHTATTEIYTLSLHDALPILKRSITTRALALLASTTLALGVGASAYAQEKIKVGLMLPYTGTYAALDRKSTRLNSSHVKISYAVFCLKKKKKQNKP